MNKRTILGLLTGLAIAAQPALAADDAVARGKYLVAVGGCTDCHTAGSLMGQPDMAHFLGGSNVGFSIPGLGVFVGPNLTSDKETGLGGWTDEQVVTAITTGVRPDGRKLAPSMPYMNLAALTHDDALAIVAYLKSLPPVKNKVPGPFGASEKVSVFVMDVLPPPVHNSLPPPPAH